MDYRALKLTVCTCEKNGLLLPKDNFTRLPFLAIFRVQTLLVLGGYLITSFQNSLILKWIHLSWIRWQRCSKKYSPKWRDLLVIYDGALRKKSPTKNRSKPCKPTKSQVRTNPPPNFDDIFLQDFFRDFLLSQIPRIWWIFFSAPTAKKNPAVSSGSFQKFLRNTTVSKTHAPLFLDLPGKLFAAPRLLVGGLLDQLPGGIICSASPKAQHFRWCP